MEHFFYKSYKNQHFESPRLSTKCFPHRIQVQYLFNVGQILRFKNQNLSNETTKSQKYGIRIGMCQPASSAAVDIVGILQTGHPLFQPHDLSCYVIICQLIQLGSNENFEVK